MAGFPEQACSICEKPFQPRRLTDRTCSLDCQIQLRRQRSRESVARRYAPRAPRPDAKCAGCAAGIPTPKTGPVPRWCRECKVNGEAWRASQRVATRRCYKCQTALPNADRKPGKAVCDDCRVDKRARAVDHEQRRRLRRYGITQHEYETLMTNQDGRCPGCGTTEPGVKGWCIDHCHTTGRVRAIMCGTCNRVLGLVQESVTRLRALADFMEQQESIDVDKDIV